ncbi:MAG TPA: PEPxxWA-CTERM sorting domain-containing protein [Sphingomonas sp.]|nr:PEPxxWA-CTERM sorting domain-containing protein [Sphingomonas sp.]
MTKRRMVKTVTAMALAGALQVAGAMPAHSAKLLSGVFPGSNVIAYGAGSPAFDVSFDLSARTPSAASPSAVVAVPEPAGWLMMLLGFGLLGAVTRRGTQEPFEAQRRA